MAVIVPLLVLTSCAALVAPAPAFAQAPKVGVVTESDGTVTVRRMAMPNPVPLKFKDDVFHQDTVATAEKSHARILLGGIAVLTLTECSVVGIADLGRRAAIELRTGKIVLAVAGDRMRPGEVILIRTMNAEARVTDRSVIAGVAPPGPQASSLELGVTTFYVLAGSTDAQPLDPATGEPSGTRLTVRAREAYSVSDTATPTVTSIQPEQLPQIRSGRGLSKC